MKRVLIILIFICLIGLFLILNLNVVSGEVIICNNCDNCSNAIFWASPGDVITLTADITNQDGNCIEFNGKDDITLDCAGHKIYGNGDGYGIYLPSDSQGSNNNLIINCEIRNFEHAIRHFDADNNILSNLIISDNQIYGIHLAHTTNTILTNITASNNRYGIIQQYGGHNTFTKITATNNHHSGIEIESGNNILIDINASDNSKYGIFLYRPDYNELTNVVTNGNGENGLHITLGSDHNTVTNLTSKNNDYSINIYNSAYNTITNSHIEDNNVGMYMAGSGCSQNNIYNNQFNNTQDILFNLPSGNYFSTTLDCTSGLNIIGGSCIGGNFWANPDGTGFSDSCPDSNPDDGICDFQYDLASGCTDYYPLTKGLGIPPSSECDSCDNCSNAIFWASPGDVITLTADITNQDGNCIEFNGKDGITLDCAGHKIYGDGDSTGYGIYFSELGDGSNNNVITNCELSSFGKGIYFFYSDNNIIDNTISSNNQASGIHIFYSNNETLTDITTSQNAWAGISIDHGMNGKAENHTLTHITTENNREGLNLGGCSYSTFTDIVSIDNLEEGIVLDDHGDHNNFTDIVVSGNNMGIKLTDYYGGRSADYNTFTNTIVSNNEYGITLHRGQKYNTFTNSHIEENSIAGLYMYEYSGSGTDPTFNLFYNNYFNNIQNTYIDFGIPGPNYFNTTSRGNFWTNPSNTGFSDTCTDSEPDGICDIQYELNANNNTDYYPLTQLLSLTCCPADNNPVDDVVSITELINYISQWKAGSVTISELITGIGEWKNGC